MSSWVVVENEAEARHAREELDLEQFSCVATSGTAYHYLESRAGVDAASIYSYIPSEVEDEIATVVDELVEQVASELDAEIASRTDARLDGWKPFKASREDFYRRFESFLRRYYELDGFVSEERPEEVIFWGSPPDGKLRAPSRPDTFAQDLLGETTTRIITNLREGELDTSFTRRPPLESRSAHSTEDQAPNGIGSSIRKYGKKVLKARVNPNLLLGLRNYRLKTIPTLFTHSGHRILVPENNSVANKFVEQCIGEGITVDWWTKKERPPASLETGLSVDLETGNHVRREVKTLEERADELVQVIEEPIEAVLPFAIAKIIKDDVRKTFQNGLGELADLYVRSRKYMAKRDLTGIVMGTTAGKNRQMLTQAATEEDVPVISFQHGGEYGYHAYELDRLKYQDLSIPNIFCTFGDKVSKNLSRAADEIGSETEFITTGCSPDTLGVNNSNSKMTTSAETYSVLYTTTVYKGDYRVDGGEMLDDISYYRHHVDVADFLDERPEEVRFKLHYKDYVPNPIIEYIEDECESVEVVRERPFVEVLPEADIVVLDYPSTVLLQSLMSMKPILYLDLGEMTWYTEAKQTLQKSIHWIDRFERGWRDEMDDALEKAATESDWSDEKMNEKYAPFLEDYCNLDPNYQELYDRLFTEANSIAD